MDNFERAGGCQIVRPRKKCIILALVAAIGLLAAAGGVRIYLRYKRFRTPTFRIADVRMDRIHMDPIVGSTDFIFTLDVTNPNDFAINLRDLAFFLEAEGLPVVRGRLRLLAMPAGSTTRVEVPTTVVFPAAAAAAMPRSIHENWVDYEMGLEGRADLFFWVSREFTVSREGQLPRINPLRWKVTEFRWIRSVLRPGLAMNFQVFNPNNFELDLALLQGTVTYKGRELARIEQHDLGIVEGGKTVSASVRVNLSARELARSARSLARDLRELNFDGQLQLVPPETLQSQLQGESAKSDPPGAGP